MAYGGGQSNDRLKDYIPVAERVERFYDKFPSGRILTAIVEHNEESGFILMRAEVYREAGDQLPAATGHAYEVRGEGHVNKTSYIENCETGAVGRALANVGFEIKRAPAGREEPRQHASTAAPRHVQTAPADTPARTAGSPEDEHRRLDRDIREALGILGRKEASFNQWVQKEHDTDSEWTELSVETKRELLSYLNAQVDKIVTATRE